MSLAPCLPLPTDCLNKRASKGICLWHLSWAGITPARIGVDLPNQPLPDSSRAMAVEGPYLLGGLAPCVHTPPEQGPEVSWGFCWLALVWD